MVQLNLSANSPRHFSTHDSSGTAAQAAEMFVAAQVPLFITQTGTFWSDWVLLKRAISRLRSIVITQEARDAPTHADYESAPCCHCAFYRASCYSDPAAAGWIDPYDPGWATFN